MAILKQRQLFLKSEQGQSIKKALQAMAVDSKYNTTSTYHPNVLLYPDNLISFVDRHMAYLNSHPQMDAWIYIANVKMGARLKIRPKV